MNSTPNAKHLGTIDSEGSGIRLDLWLSRKDHSKSRSAWQKKIKSGEIKVNQQSVTPHYQLRNNDIIEYKEKQKISLPNDESTNPSIKLNILFEDENYAVIDKPAGLVVHPGAGVHIYTLTDALKKHFKNLSTSGGENRPGIVHRLDKGTSGIMVIAKNDKTHQNLAKQFESKTVKKIYIALVSGHLTPKKGSIEAPLTRNEKYRQKISVSTNPKSRYALTHYEVIEWLENPLKSSLLKIRIETGRTHQIRVHCEAIGHPIIGDPVYGKKSINAIAKIEGLDRPFLHATRLEFISPTTHKKVGYDSPLPKDLNHLLK